MDNEAPLSVPEEWQNSPATRAAEVTTAIVFVSILSSCTTPASPTEAIVTPAGIIELTPEAVSARIADWGTNFQVQDQVGSRAAQLTDISCDVTPGSTMAPTIELRTGETTDPSEFRMAVCTATLIIGEENAKFAILTRDTGEVFVLVPQGVEDGGKRSVGILRPLTADHELEMPDSPLQLETDFDDLGGITAIRIIDVEHNDVFVHELDSSVPTPVTEQAPIDLLVAWLTNAQTVSAASASELATPTAEVPTVVPPTPTEAEPTPIPLPVINYTIPSSWETVPDGFPLVRTEEELNVLWDHLMSTPALSFTPTEFARLGGDTRTDSYGTVAEFWQITYGENGVARGFFTYDGRRYTAWEAVIGVEQEGQIVGKRVFFATNSASNLMEPALEAGPIGMMIPGEKITLIICTQIGRMPNENPLVNEVLEDLPDDIRTAVEEGRIPDDLHKYLLWLPTIW